MRAVFFDLVGTLIRSRTPIGEQYAACARRFGAHQADAGRMGVAFRQAMREAPPMTFPGRSLADTAAAERNWWRQLVRRVVSETGLSDALAGDRFEPFFRDLYHHFTTADAWEAFPDAIPALERLHARGILTGLITNYDTRVYPVLDAVGLAPLLDPVTIPALVGAAKPDPAIFAAALEQAGVEAASALYIGDELEDDYAGAQAAGMRALLLDRHDLYGGTEIRRIRSLEELVEPGIVL